MRISKLEIPEYKSIAACELLVRPLTVIFGPNNSGKTNLLEAVSRLFRPSEDPARRGSPPGRTYGELGAFWVKPTVTAELENIDWPIHHVLAEIMSDSSDSTLASAEERPFSVADVQALVPSEVWEGVANRLATPYGYDGLPSDHQLACIRKVLRVAGLRVAQLPSEHVADGGESVGGDHAPTWSEARYGLDLADIGPEIVDALDGLMDVDGYGAHLLESAVVDPYDDSPYWQTMAEEFWSGRIEWQPIVFWIDWEVTTLLDELESFVSRQLADGDERDVNWLARATTDGGRYAIDPRVYDLLDQVTGTANLLLPAFVRGEVRVYPTSASLWSGRPRVGAELVEEEARQCADSVAEAGSGYSRWAAAAIRIAMSLVETRRVSVGDAALPAGVLRDYVIILDEPEAHLHPGAVRSAARWCRWATDVGASLFVATHHEEFLRSVQPQDALLEVTKSEFPDESLVRSVDPASIPEIQALASATGMHRASVFGLRRAILYVEGVLDVAVLDELRGIELARAGILLVPMQGTRNIEGVPVAALQTQVGVKFGVLTDDTSPETMEQRSKKKRSSEERKVLKVLDLCAQAGIDPPKVFGIPERDLLHALPVHGVQAFIDAHTDAPSPEFPGWAALEKGAREHYGASPSESVHWKQFALDVYGVPLTDEDGVRGLVRWLDLNGFRLPSVDRVVDEVMLWAMAETTE